MRKNILLFVCLQTLNLYASTATNEVSADTNTPSSTPAPALVEATVGAVPTVMPASYTTLPDQYNWNASLTTTQPNKLILKTEIQNGPTLSANPYAMLALSDANNPTPAYTVNIAYQSSATKYVISVIKRNQGTMLQVLNIDASSHQQAWNYLEAWRTGAAQTFTLNYSNGSLLLTADTFVLWSWQDTQPIDGIVRAAVASSGTPLTYLNTTVHSTTTSIAPNATAFLPLSSQANLCTFQTTDALAQTIICKLYSDANSAATYELTFDSSTGIHTTLLQRSSATTSDILTSNGSYDVSSPVIPAANQTYFLSYVPSTGGATITFGLFNNTVAITLLSWTAPPTNKTTITLLSLASTSQLTSITTSATIIRPTIVPAMGLNKSGSTYTVNALAKGVAFTNNSTAWDSFLTLPQADAGTIQCDIQLTNTDTATTNGAVILWGNQAQGQPLYGILMQQDLTVKTKARFRAFTLAQGVVQYLPGDTTVDGHRIGGTYKINYEKGTGADATISIDAVVNSNSQRLANIPIPNAMSGIKFAALSCDRDQVVYSNVSTMNLPVSGASIAALNSIVRTPINQLDFNWDHSALQRIINTTAGFTLESQITFDGTTPNRSLVVGFAGSTIDTIADIFRFNSDSRVITGFAGAKIIILVTFNTNTIDITLFNGSTGTGTSAIIDQTQITQPLTATTAKLWVTYANTDSSTESISVGIDTETYKEPIYTWNNTQKQSGSLFVKNNFKKIALSSWATGVTYSSIALNTYSPPVTITPVVTPRPVVTTPNTLNRGLDAPLTYDWDIAKTIGNPNGLLSSDHGGYISCMVKINGIHPSSNIATFMIGLSSDTAQTAGLQIDTKPSFTGADYNIQIQADRTAATGYICIKRPNGISNPIEENPQEVADLKKLITTVPGSSTFVQYKMWLRYTPKGAFRYFDIGLTEASDATDINTLMPLYSFVESVTESTPLPALKNISITTWKTSAEITQIGAVQNTVDAVTDPGAADINRTLISFDGTLSSKNEPSLSQWNQAATPPTCFQINPNTVHQFTANGTANDKIVLALNKNKPWASGAIDYRFIITSTEIALYENETSVASSIPGALSTTPTLYWVKANNQTIALGGYENNDGITEMAPYISYSTAALSDAIKWFFTTGVTANGTFTYKSGTIIKQGTGSLAPTISRSGKRTASIIRRPTRIASQLPQNSSSDTNDVSRTSTNLQNQIYRRNSEMIAR